MWKSTRCGDLSHAIDQLLEQRRVDGVESPHRYLRLAARRDHADALNDLAAALASGTGAPVDKEAAARLFKRAAERGHSRAAANLANLSQ